MIFNYVLTSKNNKKNHGFTLIELLVVIAIIGILSSVVLASLNTARGKAHDARRLSELRQLQTAMELYYNDYGHYPCENPNNCSGQSIGANGKIGEGSGLDTLLAPYMSAGMQACSGKPNIAVIFARNMEGGSGNGSTFCSSWGGEGGAGQTGAYHIVLGNSDG